ncbi:MAG: sodium:solute symporter [Bacteroidales bacterium]|jgi:SSS family transporter|nr:sodium:solute symporter [Bacteroidales bacterium]
MSSFLVISLIVGFFGMLFLVSYFSSRHSTGETFFTGNRHSPWYLVAFGMIGSTISGVTFISVPGEVGASAWTYLQFLLGNFVGYWLIAFVLIPLYYRLNLVSIYTYLDKRFGIHSYRTSAFFFIVSQSISASFRLYLAVVVLQVAFFDRMNIPFWLTVLLTLAVIWLYTRKAGIKTVVWTDTIQTVFILAAVAITIVVISRHFQMSIGGLCRTIADNPLSRIFDWDWHSKTNFVKQFAAGIGITFAINGLDQNMMQKHLTCRTRRDACKNIVWFSFAFLIANILFLSLGVLLYIYVGRQGIDIPAHTDDLYPMLAINYFGPFVGALFLAGILSAAYSSADSALTALTTSFCIDILNIKPDAPDRKSLRTWVHVGFTLLMFAIITLFRIINNDSVVTAVFRVAGYTYGPLVGLFLFGMITKRPVRDRYVPLVCLLSPVICAVFSFNSEQWFGGYRFGNELLLLNSLLTFVGLWALSKSMKK